MNCYVCGQTAIKRHNRSNLCEKHHRFLGMQRVAKMDKKYVPSLYELENHVPKDMICKDCGTTMHWIDNDNRHAGAVLQHYRDGTLGIVCLSCNTKHGHMAGDSYRDLPKDHKLCSACKTIKPFSMFSLRKDGKRPYPMSKCKECNLAAHKKWREANPEKYKQLTKRHNDKKRLDPEKTRELDKKYYLSKKLRKANAHISV
jgi:hypothetical protein